MVESPSAPAGLHQLGPRPTLPAAPAARRPTQLDIARAAGVHNATVSLALRNSPSISAETRSRIKAIAERLGYHPDPALRALASYRRGLALGRRMETIAYVTDSDTRGSWRENPEDEQHFLGAQRQAAECGYQLEHFWLREPGMSPRRLGDMLYHRGISGVLLALHPEPGDAPLDLDWTRLCVVQLGLSPLSPPVHRVAGDAAGAVRLAARRVLAAGYRRPGLILPQAWDDAADQGLSLGFIMEQQGLPAERRLPVFRDAAAAIPGGAIHRRIQVRSTALATWMKELQPDAVLGHFPHVSRLLAAAGLRLPERTALVDPFHDGANLGVTGIRRNPGRVGEVAAEILVGQLQQNRRGLPAEATTTLVSGVWWEGASLPTAPRREWTPDAVGRTASSAQRSQTAA